MRAGPVRLEHRGEAGSQSSGVRGSHGEGEEAEAEKRRLGDCRGLGKSHKGLNQGHSPGNRTEGKEKGKFNDI